MEILSIREKKIKDSLEMLFSGMDDEVLKTVILYTALGKSDEEKDAVCEQIRKKKDEDLEYINSFEIEINKDTHPDILKLVNPQVNITDVVEECGDIKRVCMSPEYELTEEEKSLDNIEEHGEN
jgi:hypothetical protein